jgi:hypothetical protein
LLAGHREVAHVRVEIEVELVLGKQVAAEIDFLALCQQT